MSRPPDPATARLFLALWPDDATRAALARCRDAWTWGPNARPQPDPKLHLTLHFLGDVAVEAMAGLGAALPRFGAGFELAFGRAAVWSNGVAALEPGDAVPALSSLHERIGGALASCSIAVEARAFRPHVTLARRAHGSTPPAAPARIGWRVDRYVLVQSLPGTGRYVVLAGFD
ncbi:RNA 2',3'-cyclic phosphodiesterase [Piscinibacter koreensis]|uniref:RNA 2',3'-cyclic phosphodiesterase n=1 Tax=Piscinibacter koreensis TaxID=2742824 RepID=A0A7Y6TWU4_9BURK|nr:RNA 2',3'-cyclic phosphodiesterase [Schlegelella koreensis]